jgi:hypothetical protein
VILSHHQYVSRFNHCHPKLAEFISRPALWLWGPEHRMVIYREAAKEGDVTAYKRCIGDGGMPVELAKSVLYDFATEFVDTRTYPNDESLDVGF